MCAHVPIHVHAYIGVVETAMVLFLVQPVSNEVSSSNKGVIFLCSLSPMK